MKDFLNVLGKFIALDIFVSIILYTMWNYLIVPYLGVGKEVNAITPFMCLFLIFSSFTLFRKDINIFTYIRYTMTWWSIIGTFLISMFILWIL